MMYSLHDLLNNAFALILPVDKPNPKINALVLDSRQVQTNDLFIAIKGHQYDGRDYIPQALEQGAVAIIAHAEEATKPTVIWQKGIPIVSIPQLDQYLSHLADIFYQTPANKLTLVGVTGTNGKTTITQLLAQWVMLLGRSAAVMGTLGNGIINQQQPSKNTTGSAIDIQHQLAKFVAQKVTFCAMEVSSHGLVQHRTAALAFDVAVFSNLSRDHLDYHGSMQQYEQAKWQLFSEYQVNKRVLNVEDKIGLKWFAQLTPAQQAETLCISTQPICHTIKAKTGHWLQLKAITYQAEGALLTIDSSFGRGELKSHLIGAFNVSNLLLALATLLMLDYPLATLLAHAQQLQPVCGRMECFKTETSPTFMVDYAHTPDALMKALQAARQHCVGDLWCVFGCGGDRDKGKRPLMAKSAQQQADHIIVTDDNPRTEQPQTIINDILTGFSNPNQIVIIHERSKAIAYALAKAKPNDVILVAGKGHEDYQIIGTQWMNYSDRTTIKRLLGQHA